MMRFSQFLGHSLRKEKRLDLLAVGGTAWLLNAVFCLLLSWVYLRSLPSLESSLAVFYVFVTTFAQFCFLAALPFILTIPVALIFPRKGVYLPVLWLVSVVAFVLLLSDIFVYRMFNHHIDHASLVFAFRAGHAFEFSGAMQLWIALLVVGLCLLQAAFLWIALRGRGFTGVLWVRRVAGVVVTLALFTSHGTHAYADAASDISVTTTTEVFPLLFPTTDQNFLRHRLKVVSDETVLSNREKYRLHPLAASGEITHYPLEPMLCKPHSKIKNVLFLFTDALRADALKKEVMPNLQAFGEQNLRFMNHYSGGNETGLGLFSLYYGLGGPDLWSAFLRHHRGPVLMDEFLKQNYHVGIFQSAGIRAPELDLTAFAALSDDQVHTPPDLSKPSYILDQNSYDSFTAWLKDHVKNHKSQPFFAFVFFDAVHGYSYPPDRKLLFSPAHKPNYMTLGKDDDPTPIRNQYYNAAHYDDEFMGKMLALVKELNLMDDTLIVLSTDHGEEMNDQGLGYWGHSRNFRAPETHIPLIIHYPGKKPQVYTQQTMHYDIAPLIMRDILGCNNDFKTYSFGRELLNPTLPPREFMLISDYVPSALVVPQKNMILENEGATYKVYDLDEKPLPRARMDEVNYKAASDMIHRFN